MFGYCHLGDDELAEFGTVMLSELESIQLPMGMTIERDLYIPKEIIHLKGQHAMMKRGEIISINE